VVVARDHAVAVVRVLVAMDVMGIAVIIVQIKVFMMLKHNSSSYKIFVISISARKIS